MKGRGVTLLAKGRPPGCQQAVIDRAVGSVTQCAVLRHRWMFPQEGTAFFLVAAETIVIQRDLVQGGITQATMRIVAVNAVGFALGDWVARGQLQFGAYLCVTVQAQFLRVGFSPGDILLLVGAMAVVTCQVFLLVSAVGAYHSYHYTEADKCCGETCHNAALCEVCLSLSIYIYIDMYVCMYVS